ncbi:hypothetical protein ACI06_07085 [Salmonella enterica subsp. enterica serovar Napoli]|nr:hypothetical protein ACI06_07085 [Salmonella enterica subsp. enterica serovar Napoli]
MFLANHIDCGVVHREAPGTAIFYKMKFTPYGSELCFYIRWASIMQVNLKDTSNNRNQ